MKIADVVKLSFLNILKKKFKTLVFVFVIALFLTLLTASYTAKKTIIEFVPNYLNKNEEFRTILVGYQSVDVQTQIEELSKINNGHIVKFYPYAENFLLAELEGYKVGSALGTIMIKGLYKENSPKIIKGKSVKSVNEIICPQYFYPGYSEKKVDFIDMKEKIGTKLKIKYEKNEEDEINNNIETFFHEFTLVGVFDSEELYGDYNTCYSLDDAVSKMMMESLPNRIKERDNIYHLFVLDDVRYLDETALFLHNLGYDVIPAQGPEGEELIKGLTLISIIVTVIVIICTIICSAVFMKNIIKEQTTDFALYKTLGFDSKDIFKIAIFQLLELYFISFTLSFVFALVLKIGVEFISKNYLLYRILDIKLSVIPTVIFGLVMFLYTMIILNQYMNKIEKMSAKEVMDLL